MDLTGAYAKIGDVGVVGAFCLILMAVVVWAIREKGKAEDALAASQQDRVKEAREVGTLIAEISRVMATLAVAMEASNRTSAEGNVFRQSIAGSMESLEKAIENADKASEVQARFLVDAIKELREATKGLHADVAASLRRGGP